MATGVSVNISVEGGLQVIEFCNRKKRNALNLSAYRSILLALADAERRDDITMTVFTGAGNYYSSGNDFTASLTGSDDVDLDEALEILKTFIDTLIDHPKLLVAVVNGPAIGIACSTLCLMDAVYAHENATFHTPFSTLGICPEGCSSYMFPKIMGKFAASRMLLFSEKIGAPEALRRGLVTEIYTHVDKEYVWSKLNKMASLPRSSLLSCKRLVNSWDRNHLHKVNEEELQVLSRHLQSEEFFEIASQKFLNKSSKL